MSYNSEVMI